MITWQAPQRVGGSSDGGSNDDIFDYYYYFYFVFFEYTQRKFHIVAAASRVFTDH